jgi:hypothetical protein
MPRQPKPIQKLHAERDAFMKMDLSAEEAALVERAFRREDKLSSLPSPGMLGVVLIAAGLLFAFLTLKAKLSAPAKLESQAESFFQTFAISHPVLMALGAAGLLILSLFISVRRFKERVSHLK